MLPATRMNIERLPRSNAEAKAKLKRGRKVILKDGLDACYDVFGNKKKWTLLNDPTYVCPERFNCLFRKLELAQSVNKKDKDDGDGYSISSAELSGAD